MGKSTENIYTDIRAQRVKKMLGNFTSLFLTPKSQLLLLQGWLHCVNASKQFPSYSSPLDDLINQLGGPKKVAEMTGRRGRVVKTEKQPHPHYEARESDNSNVDSLNIQEVRERPVPASHWPKRHDCFLRWIAITIMLLVKMMILMIRMINNWLDEIPKKKEQPLEGNLTQRFFIYYGLADLNTSPDRKKFSTNSTINELILKSLIQYKYAREIIISSSRYVTIIIVFVSKVTLFSLFNNNNIGLSSKWGRKFQKITGL